MTLLNPRPHDVFNITTDEEETLALLKHAHHVLPEDTILAETWRVVEKMIRNVNADKAERYSLMVDAYTEGYTDGNDVADVDTDVVFDEATAYARKHDK